MNAHKIAIKSEKAYKANIRDERYWIKVAIKSAANDGKKCTNKNIYYVENLNWLKENGFKYTEYPDYKGVYQISWEGC